MVFQSPLRRESSTRSITDMMMDDHSSKSGGNDDADLLLSASPFLCGPSKKRLRIRRNVRVDLTQTTVLEIPSLDDLSHDEHVATYYQRYEYMQMRERIKETVEYLRTPRHGGYGATIIAQAAGSPTHHGNASVDLDDDGSVCVRGLECLADDFVGKHRKRVRQLSQTAVFAYQQQNLQRQEQQQQRQQQQQQQQQQWQDLFERNGAESSDSSNSDDDALNATVAPASAIAAVAPPPAYDYSNYITMDAEGLAQAYRRYTSECQCIAQRWGTFDAMDAGINIIMGQTQTVVKKY